jgi:hypothetical protein
MSMLRKATNRMAYAKVGIYGGPGSGKTRTATEIAIGLVKNTKSTKPVAVFDTEPAFSFVLPIFEEAGVELMVYDESRAFSDLMEFTREAIDECSVIIVDSITHIWRDLQKSYLDELNDARAKAHKRKIFKLEFHHWGPIKERFAEFTDLFLSSKAHMIVCGRAGQIYEYQDKDDGSDRKELITVGSRMATEKEMGYEPSLLIEMVQDRKDGKIVNTAIVQKDRADRINGAEIELPTYGKLRAHFDALNFGGEHFGSMEQRNSRSAFSGATDEGGSNEGRRREIALDEIKEEIIKHLGMGMDAATKAAKAKTLEDITKDVVSGGTRSWEKLSSLPLGDVLVVRRALWFLTRGHDYGQAPPSAQQISGSLSGTIDEGAIP